MYKVLNILYEHNVFTVITIHKKKTISPRVCCPPAVVASVTPGDVNNATKKDLNRKYGTPYDWLFFDRASRPR